MCRTKGALGKKKKIKEPVEYKPRVRRGVKPGKKNIYV